MLAVMPVVCQNCGKCFEKRIAEWRRAPIKRFFCTRECSQAAHRSNVTLAEKRAKKAAYDREYRERNRAALAAKKAAWFAAAYDPEKARAYRAANRERLREIQRRTTDTPEYRARKAEYDRDLRAFDYGDFWECQKLLVKLEAAVRKTPWYERAKARGYYDNRRKQDRRRA